MTYSKEIATFDGKYRFLSNFFICPVWFEGRLWPTSEHAYQAAKTLVPLEQQTIYEAKTPGVAKKLGKSVTLREDWKDVRVSIMHRILLAKFALPEMEELLLSTGNLKLIEGNTWNDTFWGVDIRTRVGQNMLGRLLMQIREEKMSFE